MKEREINDENISFDPWFTFEKKGNSKQAAVIIYVEYYAKIK